jgi:nitroreductase
MTPDDRASAFEEIVEGRRSTRAFADRPVAEETLRSVLDAVRHAPSSMNGQPWVLVVVRERERLARIAEIKNRNAAVEKRAYPSDFVASAPVAVVVCVARERSHDRERENGVIAATTLLLSATAHGLGGTYLTAYHPRDATLTRELSELLRLPVGVEPVAIIPLGYPSEPPPHKDLRPLEELVHYECFGGTHER